jgi:hypothetical protein
LLEDPDHDYTFSGYHELKGWLQGPTSFGGSRFGVWKLKFKDGVEYRFKSNPICVVGGLLKGPQHQGFLGHAEIVDMTNGIIADLHYNPF